MSLLKTFLGIGANAPVDSTRSGDTETVRRIAAKLELMEADQARYLAAFAFVLARVAQADLHLDEAEVAAMRETLATVGGLPAEEAALVCEMACDQNSRIGGSENYLVTREFRAISTKAQRAKLLECLFSVAASDGEISTAESAETLAIAEELGFTRPEALGVRSRFREHIAELKG